MVFDNVNWLSIQEVRSDKGNDILLDLVYLVIILKILKMFLVMVKYPKNQKDMISFLPNLYYI